jgi:hypothetical protein
MQALIHHGPRDIRVDDMPDPMTAARELRARMPERIWQPSRLPARAIAESRR